jgi:structural maintenance of chromosome 3 (chondroitin sulfate proteoglycan 6)
MSLSSRETYQRKIEELGSLPPHAELEKFSDKSFIELMKLLEGVNRKLKKYSHVNKKAMDQYVNFNDQRDALLKRKEELDQGAFKIVELVESLDQQKNEAINRTFRGVSAHFKDVFHELVPNGSGELIMRTAIEEDDDEEGDGQENAREKQKSIDSDNPDVNLYRGVVVKVRFSAVGENFLMSQLSGGQKALVAMALIFAIQRCDPAPFYLFDELDQALDSTYRAAVAALIQKQANDKENPTQFIVSTFRPELVQAANSWYAIDLQNKISSLVMFTKVKALGFVANLLDSEEAVGEVSTVPTSKVSRASTRTRKRKVESEDEENSPKSSTDDSTP